MGSTYFKTSKSVTHGMGRKEKTYSFMQFVPGIVIDVATHNNSYHSVKFNGNTPIENNTINKITAKPWIHDENQIIPRISELSKLAISRYQYAPLLRGMFEVPAKGDPVLLCTIGGKNYYLGPLNTENNVNFNEDNLYKSDSSNRMGVGAPEFQSFVDAMSSNNLMRTKHRRLQKGPKIMLDIPGSKPTGDSNEMPYKKLDIPGDIVFEGRQGNSIRIGSRNVNPYVYISNGRDAEDDFESSNNGGLMGITSYGTLSEHFGNYDIGTTKIEEFNLEFTEFNLKNSRNLQLQPEKNSKYFNLASDMGPIFSNRTIYNTIKSVSIKIDKSAEDILYKYRGNQMLFNSGRIF